MGGWGLNRERGERRCDGRSKCWLHEHDKKTKSRVVHVIILCYMPCAKEFTTRGAKNCFKPPPICLCSKREDAGGVDHLLLLEQVHAVWAKKPETSAGVPIKRCEFYQPSHNTASYLQLSSCQSWAQTTCRWGWWGFTVTVSAHISGQEPAYSLFVTSARLICFSVSQSYHQWSTQNDKNIWWDHFLTLCQCSENHQILWPG